MNGIVKDNKVIPIQPNETHVDKEGYFVNASSGKAALCTAVTDIPIGCIVEGAATTGRSAIALAGYKGTVRVKVNATPGTIVLGTLLTVCTDASVTADTGSGNRVPVARALESGAAGELIEAQLLDLPVLRT